MQNFERSFGVLPSAISAHSMALGAWHRAAPAQSCSRTERSLIDDAAALLGVSRRTVYYRIREGRLQTIRTRVRVAAGARVVDRSAAASDAAAPGVPLRRWRDAAATEPRRWRLR